MTRLPQGGLIDRTTPVRFRFNGVSHMGWKGDTLASALLADGVRLVGRSFKYHRPRGIFSAGSEEPNALVEIVDGAQITPNTRATMQEIHDGLEARSQNFWPSVRHDLMAVNDLAAPFLGAGFYYKTFMWPRRLWEGLYEPLIRRAAGLGRLSGKADEGVYEKAFAFCDLLVIGAGPAGLMAARAGARAGADVILCDEDARMGGRLLADTGLIDGQPGADWAAGVLAELAAMPNVRLMTRTTVTGVYDHGTFGALERVGLHLPPRAGLPRECFWRITARQAVLAAGATERGIAFPDNDRPGVMLAGAVRAYVNRWAVAPGRRVAVFGNNDDARRTVHDLLAAGVEVAALIDSRPDASVLEDVRVIAGGEVVGTRGRHGLTGITVRQGAEEFPVEVDCLAVSGGWNPSLHLTSHLGARPVWDGVRACFLPADGAVPGLTPCGAAAGVFDTAGCLADGLRAAATALEALELAMPEMEAPLAGDEAGGLQALWAVDAPGRAFVDMANDVTVKDVQLAAAENFASVEHMKRYTTQGMAPDQGRTANVTALAVLADATGRGVAATGTTTFRPPFTPVSIGALGAGGRGKGFAPERLMPSHDAAIARRAPMIEAGLWYRPSYFPLPGETDWRQSCDREVAMVRQAVGVCDVSTLGKIDVQGPDAGALLDFVYANTFSTLAEGRVRYGLMLREDGHVMDDGTAARLGPSHYLVTTTTAAAGQVMRHLEFVTQALRPDLDARIASVTDHWAQFAVAGPLAARLLGTLLDAGPDLPFMGCGPVRVMGVEGRLFRISFSGEVGYEIAVPSRYGAALWRDLVARAESLGGGPYGMEALNVLRIEKGFLTHAELHGRTTAFDLGLQGMMGKGDFIGKAAAARPGLIGQEREQLVGLRPVQRDRPITAGAHLFAAKGGGSEGYVTSACWSPTLNCYLALGFLRNGRARLGEAVRLVDHLRDIETMVEVTSPTAFDPEGGRARG